MINTKSISCYLICPPSNFQFSFSSTCNPCKHASKPSFPCGIPWRFHHRKSSHKVHLPPLSCTATEETVERSEEELEFVEIGYVSDVHGLQGEIRVKHNTDFPELRLGKPGKRWLRQQFYGKENVLEVELVAGRGHDSNKGWIIKLRDFDDVDQARQLVGSTFLASKSDRPELEEGEYYSRDLVGVRVIHKDTGEAVGTVVNVFDNGGNDLLQVMLEASTEDEKKPEISESPPLVWIPFVEAIIPVVDMEKREMQISPPKGLLELNLRSNDKSKKERRVLDWRERKKFQRRLISAKKKLGDLEQKHIFHGLNYGEKSQRSLLAEQIVSVNTNLLQQAIQTVESPVTGYNNERELNQEFPTWKSEKSLNMSKNCFTSVSEGKLDPYSKHRGRGTKLISEGKVATVLILNTEKLENYSEVDGVDFEDRNSSTISLLESLLADMNKYIGAEDRKSMPIILISHAENIQTLETLFATHDYFNFNSEKVRFIAEEKVPVISSEVEEEEKKNKVLMKSPWEILQTPIGSGGTITALFSNNIVEHLGELGVEYIELCTVNERSLWGNPTFLGYVHSCKTDIGVLSFGDKIDFEDDFHIVLPVKSMQQLAPHLEKLPLHAELKSNSHVELVNKKWVDVISPTPNSYEFHLSLRSLLKVCSLENACLIEVSD